VGSAALLLRCINLLPQCAGTRKSSVDVGQAKESTVSIVVPVGSDGRELHLVLLIVVLGTEPESGSIGFAPPAGLLLLLVSSGQLSNAA
jgi:hypothetical protein